MNLLTFSSFIASLPSFSVILSGNMLLQKKQKTYECILQSAFVYRSGVDEDIYYNTKPQAMKSLTMLAAPLTYLIIHARIDPLCMTGGSINIRK
jgi:hypothetical protein